MNLLNGILGFIILIISAVFLNTPFFAILAIPAYLLGTILFVIFYIKLIDKKEKINSFPETITFIGVILFCAILAYAAFEYNQFQGYLSHNQEIKWNWNKIIAITGINILASLLIFMGIYKVTNYQREELIILTVPTLVPIPIVIIIIKLGVISGHWMGASI